MSIISSNLTVPNYYLVNGAEYENRTRLTSLEGWDTTNMPTPHFLVRLVGLEPTWLTPTDFESVVYTDSTTVAKIISTTP